ncbi:MAG: CDC27 family protein, partial [Desulfuromonadales bacterium]
PENYENFYQVGKLFHNAGIYAKAINFLSRATNLNGNHAESQALLGQSQYNLGLYQEARNTLLRTVQLKGDHRVARYYLGLALRMTGDLEWALKELEKAERDESVRDKAILARGMVYIDQEAYPHAITALQKGIKYAQPSSETAVSMKYLLAIAAEKNRDIHLALENWEELAAEEDTNKMMVRNRYTLFLLQRDTDSLSEKHVRDFQEKMRESNAGKGIIMTTGDISPGALNYASTRPLDLYDSTRMVDILRSATGHD